MSRLLGNVAQSTVVNNAVCFALCVFTWSYILFVTTQLFCKVLNQIILLNTWDYLALLCCLRTSNFGCKSEKVDFLQQTCFIGLQLFSVLRESEYVSILSSEVPQSMLPPVSFMLSKSEIWKYVLLVIELFIVLIFISRIFFLFESTKVCILVSVLFT